MSTKPSISRLAFYSWWDKNGLFPPFFSLYLLNKNEANKNSSPKSKQWATRNENQIEKHLLRFDRLLPIIRLINCVKFPFTTFTIPFRKQLLLHVVLLQYQEKQESNFRTSTLTRVAIQKCIWLCFEYQISMQRRTEPKNVSVTLAHHKLFINTSNGRSTICQTQ